MNQVPAAEHLGRTVGEVTGHHDVERALRRVVETGEPLLDLDVALHGRRFEATYFAVRDDRGELLAVGKSMIDVTARRRAESARQRLQDATSALASAVTVAEVARGRGRAGGRALDASTAVAADPRRRARTPARSSTTTASRGARGALGLGCRCRSRCRPPTPRAPASPSSSPTRRRCSSATRGSRASPTRAPARTRRCRWSPTAARSACSRSASRTALAFDADERELLTALAAQTAIALARAQLYEREHTVSQTLQASLLPRALPSVPGLDLAARLEAGAKGVEVGGDFYDAFALGEGAWGIAIGDVCGKGVDAAALTALARHTMRAAAHAHELARGGARGAQPRRARREPRRASS